MAAKNWRGKRHPGLIWRVLFGHNGPTKGALKKAWTQTFSKTFTIYERDALTGRVQKHLMRVESDGRVVRATPKVKKKPAAAKKATGRRTASQPSKASKPSRASKSGATPRRSTASASAPAPRLGKPEPLADRVLRNPDGTLAGSRKQKAPTYAQAQQEYAKAMKNAAAASKHAEELLGWRKPQRRTER